MYSRCIINYKIGFDKSFLQKILKNLQKIIIFALFFCDLPDLPPDIRLISAVRLDFFARSCYNQKEKEKGAIMQ